MITTLINLGATRHFINIEYVWSKNLWTQHLPRAIPAYNMDGTLNEARYIMEIVDLIFQYKDHSEQSSFYVTSIGWTPVILGNTWLMEHNSEIYWHTREIHMT